MRHSFEATFRNVHLAPLAYDEIEKLRIWRNNKQNTLFLRKIPYITEEKQKLWYDTYLLNSDEISFSIHEIHELKRMVGSVGLYSFSKSSCLFGRLLIGDFEARGHKIGLNATIAALQIAFEQMEKEYVQLYVFTDNFAAIKVYEQAGFQITDSHKNFEGKDEYTMTVRREYWMSYYHGLFHVGGQCERK